MSISYSDGRAIEAKILELVAAASDLRSDVAIAREHYEEWAVRYHLTSERANLVRHLDFSGLDVLELGAGMGGVSRHLAENAKSLTVVEGTEARFSVLKERLRDLSNWSGVVANLQDARFDRKFDVVCVIGVLEYAELYLKAEPGRTPFESFLAAAAAHLRPGGSLVLAIENAIGLKYWAGSAEDHTGRLFDSICGYPEGKSPKTFSAAELKAMLSTVGFAGVDEYFPFPDYKVPASVLTREMLAAHPEVSADLASIHAYAPYGPPKWPLFPEPLAVRQLAHAGVLGELSNSHLLVAKLPGTEGAPLRRRPGIAWHYSAQRKEPTRTVFVARDGGTWVRKESLDGARKILEEPIAAGSSLRLTLLRNAYFGEWREFEERLLDFFKWSFEKWKGNAGRLDPRSIDATFPNAFVAAEGTPKPYALFDLEWSADATVPRTWFVLRNVLALARDLSWFDRGAPFASLSELYDQLCGKLGLKADLAADIAREARFQSSASSAFGKTPHDEAIRLILERQLRDQPRPPRSPSEASSSGSGAGLELDARLSRAVGPMARMVFQAARKAKSLLR